MAVKLRKMLGSATSPSAISLMKLIDSQSKETICRWCIDYAKANFLPIFEKRCPDDPRPKHALESAEEYLAGKVKFTTVKDVILNECHAAARELDGDPAAQAAARACGQASAVVHTLTHSLGLYFYGAAAVAYDRLGTQATNDAYSAVADEIGAELIASLKAVAVEDEPNPVNLTWHC